MSTRDLGETPSLSTNPGQLQCLKQAVVGCGQTRIDAQGLAVVLDRLGRPALGNERCASVGVGDGINRRIIDLNAESLAEVRDRLGRLARVNERGAPGRIPVNPSRG